MDSGLSSDLQLSGTVVCCRVNACEIDIENRRYGGLLMTEIVEVAVAAIVNTSNEVLICLRHQAAHQGGLWEFPGGKVEPGETIEQALYREIEEELNLLIQSARPLITLKHCYTDKTVRLHVWKVDSYSFRTETDVRKNTGAEGQPIKWQSVYDLDSSDFPSADKSIIRALQLPDLYLISGNFNSIEDFKNRLCSAIKQGIHLFQLRLKLAWVEKNRALASCVLKLAIELCERNNVSLMLNIPDELSLYKISEKVKINTGVHLDSQRLQNSNAKNIEAYRRCKFISASCHTPADIIKAQSLELDFIVLSPVQKTTTHPDAKPLGWQQFSVQAMDCVLPVYALGGVSAANLETAWCNGAQGIAGIGFCW